jgi:hypothetical protein
MGKVVPIVFPPTVTAFFEQPAPMMLEAIKTMIASKPSALEKAPGMFGLNNCLNLGTNLSPDFISRSSPKENPLLRGQGIRCFR